MTGLLVAKTKREGEKPSEMARVWQHVVHPNMVKVVNIGYETQN